MKALIVTPDLEVAPLELAADSATRLTQLQRAVGGYIEFVDLREDCTMIANEESKLGEVVEENALANALLQIHGTRLIPGDFIAGTVVIVGQDAEGEFTSISPSLERLITALT